MLCLHPNSRHLVVALFLAVRTVHSHAPAPLDFVPQERENHATSAIFSTGPARPLGNRTRFPRGIGGLLAITEVAGTSTNIFLPIADQVGTIHALVAAVTNNVTLSTPTVAARYEYSPFGELLERDGPYATSCPIGFQSKYRDAETGFWYFGYRFFDSRCAQWLTHDPLREEGGFNLAAFCGGDPVNKVDPLGLWEWDNDFVSTALGSGAQNAQAVWKWFWGNLAQAARNTSSPLPVAGGTGFAATCWNNVAGTGNWLWNGTFVPAFENAEPRPQDAGVGLELFSSSLLAQGVPPMGRLEGVGLGALMVVGGVGDSVDFLPGFDDVLQRSVREAGADFLRRRALNVTEVIDRSPMRFAEGPRIAVKRPAGYLAGGSSTPNAGGIIRSFVQEHDQVYYRVFSENVRGRFLTAKPPRNSAWAREALALPEGNLATYIQEVIVPAGTRLQRSRALPAFGRRGGAEQFELLEWIPDGSFGVGRVFP